MLEVCFLLRVINIDDASLLNLSALDTVTEGRAVFARSAGDGGDDVTEDAVLATALDAAACISDPKPPWTGILDSFRELVGGESASFIAFQGRHLVTCEALDIDPVALNAYEQHFHSQDIFLRTGPPRAPGTWLDTQQVLTAGERANNAYCVDFMDRYRMRQMVSFIIDETDDRSICMTVQRDFVRDDIAGRAISERIVQYGAAVRASVARREAAASMWLMSVESAFGSLGEAVAVVNHHGVVVHLSAHAKELMEGDSALRLRAGRLWHSSVECRDLLAGALLRAALTDSITRLQIPDDGVRAGSSLELVAADMRLRFGREKLIFMRIRKRQSRTATSVDQLSASFGVTQAEARVWSALIAGQSPRQYADGQGVSINTVRKQIATLMEKVGCTRQVDLVRKGLV